MALGQRVAQPSSSRGALRLTSCSRAPGNCAEREQALFWDAAAAAAVRAACQMFVLQCGRIWHGKCKFQVQSPSIVEICHGDLDHK